MIFNLIKNNLIIIVLLTSLTNFYIKSADLSNRLLSDLVSIEDKQKLASLAEELINKGANVNAKNVIGATPLQLAARKGLENIVKLLVNKGADINAQDQYGFTALIEAVYGNHKNIVDFLISKGANVNLTDNQGKTAYDIAQSEGYSEIAKLIATSGEGQISQISKELGKKLLSLTNLNYETFEKSKKIYYQQVKKFLEQGADVNARETLNKSTPLMLAARNGLDTIAELLIDSGAFINSQDNTGLTALMEAIYANHKNIVNFLLQYGADISLKTNEGETAYDIAKKEGHEDIAELIKSYENKYNEYKKYLEKWREQAIKSIIEKRNVPKEVAIEIVNRTTPPTYVRWIRYLNK